MATTSASAAGHAAVPKGTAAAESSNVTRPEVTPLSANASSSSWWAPKASDKLTWQIQLQGTIKTNFDVTMYDVDLFDTPQSVIDKLHADGRIVVCYFSAGSYEHWRTDWADFFPFITVDQPYTGKEPPFAGKMARWDERWLDIRSSRIALAKSKGCDAVDPDNMDAFTQDVKEIGISLNYTDQLTYNRFIANTAHAHGLAVGLKNDLVQIEDLVDDFDFAINEQCFQYNECHYYQPFTKAEKAVFGIEYKTGPLCRTCKMARRSSLSVIKKKLSLKAWRQGCNDRRTVKFCSNQRD